MLYETYLGPDDFGPRKGAGLVILHTTETAGTTLEKAKQLAFLQAAGRLNGSYNKIICTDGVLTTVPDDHISGGVNPFSSFWDPEAWLYGYAPAFKVNDPNSYALELSFMGTKLTYDTNGWPSQMIDAAARLILAEEARTGMSMLVCNHEDFQTNRSDAGPKATDLVMARYQQLVNQGLPDTSIPPEEPMIDVNLYRPIGSVVFRGGSIYLNCERTHPAIGSVTPGTRFQIFAIPTSPTEPNGTKSSLVPALMDRQGGPGEQLVLVGIGFDQMDPTTFEPVGWTPSSAALTDLQRKVAAAQAALTEAQADLVTAQNSLK